MVEQIESTQQSMVDEFLSGKISVCKNYLPADHHTTPPIVHIVYDCKLHKTKCIIKFETLILNFDILH